MSVDPVVDAEIAAWNAVLATGDRAAIEHQRENTLRAIHERIMDADPPYRIAGWTPSRGGRGGQ